MIYTLSQSELLRRVRTVHTDLVAARKLRAGGDASAADLEEKAHAMLADMIDWLDESGPGPRERMKL